MIRTISGSHGSLRVTDDGSIDSAEYDGDGYKDIVGFDMAEFRTWAAAMGHPEWADEGIDILDIGFWTDADEYVEPDEDHRAGAVNGGEP